MVLTVDQVLAEFKKSGALLEDYVELISDLLANRGEARPTDIARRLGVAHATAIKTIGRLTDPATGTVVLLPSQFGTPVRVDTWR